MDQEHYHCGTCQHGVLYSMGCGICEDKHIRQSQNDMKTFQQWSFKGFTIKKGSKATKINGECYFSKDQVYLRKLPTGGQKPQF